MTDQHVLDESMDPRPQPWKRLIQRFGLGGTDTSASLSHYAFWHYTGPAFEVFRHRLTGRRIPTMDFSIRSQAGDVHVELAGYDFPIRDGQEVTVVCARGKDVKQGQTVHFINSKMRVSATMMSFAKQVAKDAHFPGGRRRFDYELERYLKSIRAG